MSYVYEDAFSTFAIIVQKLIVYQQIMRFFVHFVLLHA